MVGTHHSSVVCELFVLLDDISATNSSVLNMSMFLLELFIRRKFKDFKRIQFCLCLYSQFTKHFSQSTSLFCVIYGYHWHHGHTVDMVHTMEGA